MDTQPNHNPERLNENARLIEIFKSMVIPLGCTLPNSCEVVLHDLNKLPNSIIAIYGSTTGRAVGDPATDRLLRSFASNDFRTVVGYQSEHKDGRKLRSSTIILNGLDGSPIAALCINCDVSMWYQVQQIAESMTNQVVAHGGPPSANTQITTVEPQTPLNQHTDEDGEIFVHDVDDLAIHLIRRAINAQQVPVSLMKKAHKLDVVRSLKKSGLFLLRDAVDMIAEALDISRFTVYNYVNEIEAEVQG